MWAPIEQYRMGFSSTWNKALLCRV